MAELADRLAALATGAPSLGRARRAGRYEPSDRDRDGDGELDVVEREIEPAARSPLPQPPRQVQSFPVTPSPASRGSDGGADALSSTGSTSGPTSGSYPASGPHRTSDLDPARLVDGADPADRRAADPPVPADEFGRPAPTRPADADSVPTATAVPPGPTLEDLIGWIEAAQPQAKSQPESAEPTPSASVPTAETAAPPPTAHDQAASKPVDAADPVATEAGERDVERPAPAFDELRPSPSDAGERLERSTVVHIGSIEIGTDRVGRKSADRVRPPAPAPLQFAGPSLQQFLEGRR